MSDNLGDLGWPEATLFDFSFNGTELKFSMLDLLAYGNPLKFEVAKVAISDIEALRIELSPYVSGAYKSKIVPVDIGSTNGECEGFEGIIHENHFCETKGEYFWISSDLKANNIEVERTGEFKYVPRAG